MKCTYLLGFLLELVDCSFVDAATFVDQVTSSGRFSRIYVANDDDVNMLFFLRHGCLSL